MILAFCSFLNKCAKRFCPFRKVSIGLRSFGLMFNFHLPFSTSNNGQKFVSTASFSMSSPFSGGVFQLVGHVTKTFKNAGPFVSKAFLAFFCKSKICEGEHWATYGMSWAIIISARGFLFWLLP